MIPRLLSTLIPALLLSLAAAQENGRYVAVQNLAPHPRHEWISTVVPFAQGEAPDLPEMHVEGIPTVWEPFGARWPDGSLRQVVCSFPYRLEAMEEKRLPLVAGAGPEPAPPLFSLPPRVIRFVAKIRGKTFSCEPKVVEILSNTRARQVAVMRGRLGDSGFVVEATIEVYSHQSHAWFGFGLFFSDPSKEELDVKVDELAVETEGMALFLRHSQIFGVLSKIGEDGSRTTVLQSRTIGDGQGIRRTGVLVPPLEGGDSAESRLRDATIRAALLCRPLAAASGWPESGAFGVFGRVPGPPPWMAGEGRTRAAFARRHAAFVQWSRTSGTAPLRKGVHGLEKAAGQAGEQADFGVVAVEPVAGTAIPSFLFEVEWSVLQEACRPVHFFELDASPVLVKNHPDWVVWDGRTHYHCEVSTDRLGKPCPAPKFETNGWKGKDREHWSNNYLCGYYLLTADPNVLLEIRNEAQLYLAMQTVEKRFSTSGPGNARAVGRALLSASWLYLCTGDPAILQRMRDRMHIVYQPVWSGEPLPPDYVRPFQVRNADPRYGVEGPNAWVPWEESLTVVGFEAYRRLSGDDDPKINELIDGVALTLLREAWRLPPGGRPQIAYAIRWFDGKAMTPEQRNDEKAVTWPRSDFGTWGIGSVEVGRLVAERLGEEELAERAREILKRMRSSRSAPNDGFYDRFSQWDGVR